jgi:proteasome lid subunit RPN8/RPN11
LVSFVVPADLFHQFREDLSGRAEAAGFFLADYDSDGRAFRFREWRAIPESGFESRSEFHLVLRDEVQAEAIKWAWDEGASLVEAHSHQLGDAEFSWSDLAGLREWVPHLWWRLRGRPYGAIILDGETLDALAWIEDAVTPEQVVALEVATVGSINATGRTLAGPTKRGERRRGW